MLKRRVSITTGTVAEHCEVTYETVKNWIKGSKLPAYETPGGHHRILITEFHDFLNRYNMPAYVDSAARKPRILLVDDNETLTSTMSEYFTKVADYDCETAADGFEAGIQITTFEPDLVVLDLVMPAMNGFEVCEKIKSAKETKHILVLAITGQPEDGNAESVMGCGADDLLVKPFKMDALQAAVDRLLSKKKKRRSAV